MSFKKVSEFVAGEDIMGFYLIKAIECKTTNNNKKFLDITLTDKTGEINAKLWECSDEDEITYVINKLVKIKGSITQWQNQLQLKVDKIRLALDEDGLSIDDFVPSAPKKGEEMFNEILDYIEKIKNQGIKKIVKYIVDDSKEKLMTYPAAKQNHHAIRCGLLYHINTMLNMGEKLSEIYTWLNKDLIYAGIILHDICKVEEMEASELGIVSDYTMEGYLLGHIIQGIKKIDRVAKSLDVDEEISILLQHMILSHHYEPEFGSPKRPMIPEAEVLHYIDMIDARMYDMEKTLSRTEDSKFSEKVWVLHNRKLYKPAIKCD